MAKDKKKEKRKRAASGTRLILWGRKKTGGNGEIFNPPPIP